MPLITTLLFPHVPGLRVEQVVPGEAAVQVVARMTRRGARCPLCRRRSRRVHSRYMRRLADLPCVGRPLVLTLHTRRFVCRHPPCPRMIFTERVPALVAPWARRTTRVQESLRRHGFALGGRPGARHATAEGIAVSPRTVLRLVRATPLPPWRRCAWSAWMISAGGKGTVLAAWYIRPPNGRGEALPLTGYAQ